MYTLQIETRLRYDMMDLAPRLAVVPVESPSTCMRGTCMEREVVCGLSGPRVALLLDTLPRPSLTTPFSAGPPCISGP